MMLKKIRQDKQWVPPIVSLSGLDGYTPLNQKITPRHHLKQRSRAFLAAADLVVLILMPLWGPVLLAAIMSDVVSSYIRGDDDHAEH